MIKTANKQKDNTGATIRRRLSAAICMLLIATVMLVTSTYAWFTLSTAPEVTGINTSVAGNGSLEIALMPTNGQFGGITSGRGASGTEYGGNKVMTEANVAWGNVVNLKDPSYGLNLITLNPIQFNAEIEDQEIEEPLYDDNGDPVMDGENQATVTKTVKVPTGGIAENAFSRPAYGSDGRITMLKDLLLKSKDTSADFDSDNYGVRAIVDEAGSTYGYVIDLALRLNSVAAADENSTTLGKLLLQTDGAQRIYSDGNAAATQGGGSRLWFQDENGNDVSGVDQALATEYLKVMRIAFVQDFGNASAVGNESVLAYAKADINTGYLSLCDYYGEPLTAGSEQVILSQMIKNKAYQISVVVWLDGTNVTNANMAIDNTVLSKATLNLQFSTDVTLTPAENANVRNNPPAPATTAAPSETAESTAASTEAATTTSTAAPVEP